MTDTTASGVAAPGRDEARRRIARRYAAERRFRAYGLTAVAVTALFVFFLIGDILTRGIPAFFEHRLNLTLVADGAVLDPDRSGDPSRIRAGDFDKLIRDALRAQFPDVESRSDRKLLLGLLSAGAADDMRERVAGDPTLIGREITVPVVLSDDADLYLKGEQTAVSRSIGASALSIADNNGEFRLSTDGPAFAPALDAVKAAIAGTHARSARELARLEGALAELDATLAAAQARVAAAVAASDAAAETEARADEAKAAADRQALATIRDTLKSKVDDLAARLSDRAGTEILGGALPSLIVETADGSYLVHELGTSTAVAVPAVRGAVAAAGKDEWSLLFLETPESDRRVSDREVAWLETLKARGIAVQGFAWRFLTSGDSREAELAGIRGALTGSILTLLVTIGICLPLGVGAAIYLEEFAPKNRLTDLIEVNINNLAAVPSIVFGLLGLAMFLNFFGLPRSAPLVGGLVLALLVLPTIIIASRAALKAVPPSIKEAALGVGASHQQAVFHHVLPLAVPGIMTGTIIGMAHALGETAPLLMIGMVAFIVDIPSGLTSAATALPVQIYLWSDLPEVAFKSKTAGAILVLLALLFVMNALAILVRKKFERRW